MGLRKRPEARVERGWLVSALRDLRLFWKVLLPFMVLIVVMGVAGAFVIVRDLSSRAQASLDDELSRRSVDAQAFLRDQELYLLDSVRLAANLAGMPKAVLSNNTREAVKELSIVAALRTTLNLIVVADRSGRGLAEFSRERAGAREVSATGGTRWTQVPFIKEALGGVVDPAGDKRPGFLRVHGVAMLATAGPIRSTKVVGVAVAGLRIGALAEQIAQRVGAGIALYDDDGGILGSAGRAPRAALPQGGGVDRLIRRNERAGSEEIATLYVPLVIRGVRTGTFAVSVPSSPAFASVRGTGLRLALFLVVAMAAVVGIGALLSRFILRQVRPLVDTNRALGRGDLAVRAPVLGNDELGELARGFNQMAEQLQASYEELERRVQQRTEELQRLYQEVKRSAEARSEFFAAMSHEFRTPLFAILGHADMLLDERFAPKGPAWRGEFGRTIKESGQHLLTVVNQILDLAKMEAGRLELDVQRVRLDDVVSEIQNTIVPLARTSELDVDIDLPRGLPEVQADPVHLKEIVLNLVSNAIKYTPAGGKVRLSAVASDGGAVEVSVADTGVGIPRNAADRIFEPFYQVKGTRAQRGQASSGLGLALTKRLVEAHGGEIWFRSKPGGGTTFTFTVPRATDDVPGPKRARTRATT